MEPLFRGSNGDQKRYGGVVSRKQTVVGPTSFKWDRNPPFVKLSKGERGGFEVMLELVLVCRNLNLTCSLATYADQERRRV